MKKALLLLLILVPGFLSAANEEKVLYLKKASLPIKVDGIIDAEWTSADSVKDFFQLQPYYGQAPTRKTIAKVLTTENSLYCLIVSYDDQSNLQLNSGKQDDFGGDIVSIMLDTFGDNRTAYKFAVTASA